MWNAKTAALIELKVDPDAIVPHATLSGIRAKALKAKVQSWRRNGDWRAWAG